MGNSCLWSFTTNSAKEKQELAFASGIQTENLESDVNKTPRGSRRRAEKRCRSDAEEKTTSRVRAGPTQAKGNNPGGGGGVLIIFLGGSVLPGPENPYPISDQNIRFSLPYFRPDSQNVYPIPDPVCVAISATLNRIYGVRNFVTPNDVRVFFSSRYNVLGNTLLLKMVSQTKQAEYTPYFRPKRQNLYPISD